MTQDKCVEELEHDLKFITAYSDSNDEILLEVVIENEKLEAENKDFREALELLKQIGKDHRFGKIAEEVLKKHGEK